MARVERVVEPADFTILKALLVADLFVRQALPATKVNLPLNLPREKFNGECV